MQPEIKARWIEALRSGEYRQGSGLLRSGSDTFCCMGVLCDLYLQAHGGQWHRCEDGAYFSIEGKSALVPSSVVSWSGFPVREEIRLTRLNDFDKKTFAEIADIVERELEEAS